MSACNVFQRWNSCREIHSKYRQGLKEKSVKSANVWMLLLEQSCVLKLMKKVDNNEPPSNTACNLLTKVSPPCSLLLLTFLFFLPLCHPHIPQPLPSSLTLPPTYFPPLSPLLHLPLLAPFPPFHSMAAPQLHVRFPPPLLFMWFHLSIPTSSVPPPSLLPISRSCLHACPFIRSLSCHLMGCCCYGNAGRTCLHSSMRKTIACKVSLSLSSSLSQFLFFTFFSVKFKVTFLHEWVAKASAWHNVKRKGTMKNENT